MRFSTSSEIIDQLGGTMRFGDWFFGSTEAKERQKIAKRVTAWRRNGFPSATYVSMARRLKDEKGIDAPPSVWGQKETGRA